MVCNWNNKKKGIIITIDGPAGAGKSTVARKLARILGFNYINTGDLYRYITYCALCKKVDVNNAHIMNEFTSKMVKNYMEKCNCQNLIDHINTISEKIHSPEIDKKVSFVAQHYTVRKILIPLQRSLAQDGAVVIEGRDIGTVILPNADVKFFLTADINTRIMRRFTELQEKGFQVTLSEIKNEITNRDYIDSQREIAPLSIPKDAILINTSNKNIDEVVNEMLDIIKGLKGYHK